MMIATFLDPRFKLFAFEEDDEVKKKQVLDAVRKAALEESLNVDDESNDSKEEENNLETSTNEVCIDF